MKKVSTVKKMQKGGAKESPLARQERIAEEFKPAPMAKSLRTGPVNTVYYRTPEGAYDLTPPKNKNNVFEKTSKTLSKKLAAGAKPKSKFGGPVNVQPGKIGKIRSSNDQGYTAIGKREPARIIKKTITKKK